MEKNRFIDDFDTLFRVWSPLVWRYSFMILKEKDKCDDVVQEVFVRIWLKKSWMENVRSFGPFLYTLTKHTIYDMFFRGKTQSAVSFEDTALHDRTEKRVDEDMADRLEIRDILDVAYSVMPARMGVIFKLSRQYGLKNREIAAFLGISIKTVEYNLNRAKKKLLQIIEE